MERTLRSMLFIPTAIAVILCSGLSSLAQETAPQNGRQLKSSSRPTIYDDSRSAPDQDLQLLRRDLRSQKKQIVAANMDFTDAEAEKFWPVYDRYVTELAKIYDNKIALVQEYFDTYQTMTGDQADSYIRRRTDIEENIMQLRIKYIPEFRKVLSGRQTALLFQIDYRLDLLINLLLIQTPLIDP